MDWYLQWILFSAVVEENIVTTGQMAASASQVTLAIELIASVSEENSASVEEVSASTEEMSAQAEELAASVTGAFSNGGRVDGLNQTIHPG